mgnify:FL=1|tara:strand:+ start:277 stop:465 length:189 start_codon:yes stop_codon:yes gene_type:complete
MAKLKVNRIVKIICDTCRGNGYIKVEKNVHQCWDCDSEGEFYEDIGVDSLIGDTNGGDNTLH